MLLEAYRQAICGEHTAYGDLVPVEDVRAVEAHLADIARNPGAYYRFHHDFETYCELDVTDVGSDAYARHHSCEVLMLGYAVNGGEIGQWVPAESSKSAIQKGKYSIPSEIVDHMRNPRAVKFAWNKPFEWGIWSHVLGIETAHHHWKDPMILAYSLSLPGSLDKAGAVVDLPEDMRKKKARGTQLIGKFSKPRKPSKRDARTRNMWFEYPEEWEEFKEYNRTDVLAERGIYIRMKPFDMPVHEWVLWVIDQWINQAGIPFNMKLVRNCIAIYEHLQKEDMSRLESITGLDNGNSPKQLLPWLQDRGYPFNDLKKGHVKRAIERMGELAANSEDPGEVAQAQELVEVLELRSNLAKASPKKFYAIERAAEINGDRAVLRNSFQFAGAGRTWRWAGRIFQAQNLPRPATKFLEKTVATVVQDLEKYPAPYIRQIYDLFDQDPYEVLTTAIRPCAQAEPGYVFVDADLNAIENRVLGWMADCKKILKVFEDNLDPYISFGTYMFGKTYDMLWHEYKVLKDSTHRTIAKPGVLGCGYMLGAGQRYFNKDTAEYEATGLLGYAWNMGIKEFTLEDSKLSVDTFRREFTEVKDMWYDLERAAKKCVRTGQTTEYRMLRFEMHPPFLKMVLPSGRALHYCRPRIEMVETPWGEEKEGLTYEGLNDKNQWVRISTHPGKITENADQAISRDLLANALYLGKLRYNMDFRIHVHDQAVTHSRIEVAERDLERLQECLGEQPHWAPGLPLGSAGFVSPIFIKD